MAVGDTASRRMMKGVDDLSEYVQAAEASRYQH